MGAERARRSEIPEILWSQKLLGSSYIVVNGVEGGFSEVSGLGD